MGSQTKAWACTLENIFIAKSLQYERKYQRKNLIKNII